jgi:hypothetical protein
MHVPENDHGQESGLLSPDGHLTTACLPDNAATPAGTPSAQQPSTGEASAVLPVGYYLEHFQTVLETVGDRYGDLLQEPEKAFSQAFRLLDLDSRRLYVRLISRQGPLFRSDRLSYAEIADLPGTWEKLAQAGFLTINAPEFLREALELLTAPELRELATAAGLLRPPVSVGEENPAGEGNPGEEVHPNPGAGPLPGRLRKGDWLALIRSRVPSEVLLELLKKRFQWLFPAFQEILRVFRLLFFGTPEPDLSAFVLHDLGKVRFETYPLVSPHRLFARRVDIDRALQLRDHRDELYQTLEEAEESSLLAEVERLTAGLPPAEGHPRLIRWRRRFLEHAGRFWERQDQPLRALAIYDDPETQPSRDRRARLLVHLGKTAEASAACAEILASPRDPEEEDVAESLQARLAGKRRREITEPGFVETLILSSSDENPRTASVELRALENLSRQGFAGFWGENRLWTSLFGLAFWDILFLPIPRAFGHPFQAGPTDLFTPEFRIARESAIAGRLAEFTSDEEWRRRVLDTAYRKEGIANALIDWTLIPLPLLEKILGVLPGSHVQAIFDRLTRNPGGFKTGFPDLFLFTSDSPGYLLIEVKGPGDRLQNNQRSWMRYFARHGIPCQLLRVEYPAPKNRADTPQAERQGCPDFPKE